MHELRERTEGEQMSTARPSESQHYRVLADGRRRCVLDLLADRETSVGIEELADAVHERERERERDDDTTRTDVLIALHHVHLPLMDDAGVLEYDADRNRVEPDAGLDAVADGWPTA